MGSRGDVILFEAAFHLVACRFQGSRRVKEEEVSDRDRHDERQKTFKLRRVTGRDTAVLATLKV